MELHERRKSLAVGRDSAEREFRKYRFNPKRYPARRLAEERLDVPLDLAIDEGAERRQQLFAVALAEDGVITPEQAVLRVEPRALPELLHRQVDPAGKRDACPRGIAASPGAATGGIVFSRRAAQEVWIAILVGSPRSLSLNCRTRSRNSVSS